MENFFILSRTNNSSFMWFRRHRIGMFHKFRCKASKFRRGNRMWRNRTFCFDALDKIFGIFFIQLWSRFDFKRQSVPPFCLNDWLCLISTKVQLDRTICQVFYRSKHFGSTGTIVVKWPFFCLFFVVLQAVTPMSKNTVFLRLTRLLRYWYLSDDLRNMLILLTTLIPVDGGSTSHQFRLSQHFPP